MAANINTNANFQTFQQGLQIAYGPYVLFMFMSGNIATKLSDKVYHEKHTGNQIYLERPVSLTPSVIPTYDGEGGNNILTKQESYKATITQYSFAASIANETIKTMDSRSASISLKNLEDQIKQSATNGAELILLQFLATGVTSVFRGTGGSVTAENKPGALTQTDVVSAARRLDKANVVKFTESLKPSRNINTWGINPAYALIVPIDLLSTMDSFSHYISPARYGKGQEDVLDFMEKGSIDQNPSIKIFASTLPEYNNTDADGAYMCYVFGKQAFATALMNTQASSTQKGIEDTSVEDSLSYRMGLLVNVHRETFNTASLADKFLTQGALFSAQIDYAHFVLGPTPVVGIRATKATTTAVASSSVRKLGVVANKEEEEVENKLTTPQKSVALPKAGAKV